ncbi:MAG: tRNA glutamyl-Q(34) synthetase GluQRS [Bacteroidales bacterium]|nr:tRNA glutamyl-Q(34) synthetase GluQRS [Bacteroidales bacterium]
MPTIHPIFSSSDTITGVPASDTSSPIGRFAPSPTGRMHLGNLFTALLSWLSVRSRGGRWVLRIEDLDPQRSKREATILIEEDLRWLGLYWDEGGLENRGPHGPYSQSERHNLYEEALDRIKATGFCYPCSCSRADILATQAPHQSDGRVIYGGHCRPAHLPDPNAFQAQPGRYAVRLNVPDREIEFCDIISGRQRMNLSKECGDFILRRADGAWAYQLAVVVDDAAMGVTEVVRGNDLLLSAAQQIYLQQLLGYPTPRYAHLPLICNSSGQRLSKRDHSLSMEAIREKSTPEETIGLLAHLAGLIPEAAPISLSELIPLFSWDKLSPQPSIIL